MTERRTRERARRGFTLVEILIALVIASVVAALGYGVLATATDLGARISSLGDETAGDSRIRAMLADALRHPAPPAGVGEAMFVAETSEDGDRLSFLTRGIETPLGAGGTWRMDVWSDSAGLHVTARPLGTSALAPIQALLRGASALAVHTSDRAEGPGWTRGWHRSGRAPAFVALSWRTAASAAPQLVVRLALEEAR